MPFRRELDLAMLVWVLLVMISGNNVPVPIAVFERQLECVETAEKMEHAQCSAFAADIIKD